MHARRWTIHHGLAVLAFLLCALALVGLPWVAFGQLTPGNFVTILDEGVVQGKAKKLDCVGAGIACTVSGVIATITAGGGGGGGAPTDATYWVGAANATLTNEINLGALGTGLVLNTAGTPSIYAGTSCTNQVLRLLDASGAGTCVTITSAYTTGTFPGDVHALLSATHSDTVANAPLRGALIVGNVTPAWARLALGGNNLYLKSNASDLLYSTLAAGGVGACTNQAVTALNADAVPTCSTITSAFVDASIVPSVRLISTTAPLAGGGDLSANRTLTTSMNTARLIGRTTAAAGVMEEITVAAPLTFSALTLDFDETVTLGNNARVMLRKNTGADVGARRRLNLIEGTNITLTVADDAGSEEVDITIAAAGGSGYSTIEDEGVARTQRATVNFVGAGVSCVDDGASKTVCTISGGGAGSANVAEVSLSLGTGMGLYYSTTVTGQAWVTSSSVIVCSMFGTTADGQTPETIAVAGIVPTVSDRVVGTGFNLNVMNPNGATGTVRAHCTGA